MHKSTALALYGLHIDAFLLGFITDAPEPSTWQLTEQEAVQVRTERYKEKILNQRARQAVRQWHRGLAT